MYLVGCPLELPPHAVSTVLLSKTALITSMTFSVSTSALDLLSRASLQAESPSLLGTDGKVWQYLRTYGLKRTSPSTYTLEEKATHRDVVFAVLEKVYGAERTKRQLREGLWIKKLATGRPDGCNVKDSCVSAML